MFSFKPYKILMIQLIKVMAIWMNPSFLSAYPSFIGHGYQSCMSCHYNPHGNGPLTDYGRSVSAGTISDRMFVDDQTSEEELAANSGFLVEPFPLDWLRPSASVRNLYLSRKSGSAKLKNAFIPMDLSATLVAQLLPHNKLILAGHLAYASTPRALHHMELKKYRTREHYIGYRLTKQLGLYAGLMDKVFGLRIDDHTAFSRVATGLTQNDQAHGVVVHFINKKIEIGINPFVGNLVQEKELRQKGVSSLIEYTLAKKHRVGISALFSESKYLKFSALSLQSRLVVGKGHSYLGELGQTDSRPLANISDSKNLYMYHQFQYHFSRGHYGNLNVQYFREKSDSQTMEKYRFSLGPQLFPVQRVEFRADVQQELIKVAGVSDHNTLSFLTQIHIWL